MNRKYINKKYIFAFPFVLLFIMCLHYLTVMTFAIIFFGFKSYFNDFATWYIKSTVLIASNSARSDALVPEKLIDCSTTDRKEAELFIVEGNSASDGLRQCRDPRIHAIMPLRGKPLNTAGLEIERVLSNREMKDLISQIYSHNALFR